MGRKSRWAWIKETPREIIPADIQEQTRQRVLAYAEKILPGKASWLRVRFRNRFCYIDAEEPNDPVPLTHLARLTWRGDPSGWEVAFYVYSSERYQACVFGSREWGTPEEALKLGAGYLGAPLLG